MVYLSVIVDVSGHKTNRCEPLKYKQVATIKYIFNLAYWREFHNNEQTDQTSLCDIPDELRPISNAICRAYNLGDCRRLPCRMIYASSNTLEDIKCMNGGRILKNHDDHLIEHQSNVRCKRGYTLDLFLKQYAHAGYPSIIADPLTPISNELYHDVLNNRFRTCDSMWGFIFNFESIGHYPWTTDNQNLKLFDITFGYDRSMYDLIPAPWLFNYVERLKFNSKRMSVEKVMSSKKPIYSVMSSNVYWTNTPTISQMQNQTINVSHVQAPILWMNSNCKTISKRTEYMHELMKYIDVDNYGTCGNNIRNLPDHIVKIQQSSNRNLKDRGSYSWEEGKLALSNEYLFTIAIENSLNYDYVTEKLWHPLVAGSIPIYLGAPNIEDWLPCKTTCIIDLRNFQTPKDAALYIRKVATNRTLYESYHQWRNEPLCKTFQNMLNYFQNISDYSLDCILCDMSYQVGQGENPIEIKRKLKTMIGHF
ncbi:unnamed protein product [Rotaria magnacalcarata]|uniref:Fucosyltransferase n=1 Tax=Rotaria magnacalcarata TaxID=392030 RepID=A0A814S7Z3_9BILA|nr:unnamed protein product [Rotaria magnacalcarata]CAF1600053.1 unnamed protein product [Rotaria magnacalcarata]CAF2032335.1 unnamed protein product [Rotaria magnacalcarata]CAF2114640.1 unnamed protein product [Rotaria magnacalcarata]CAF3787774.1 unnamed protein product [Rotaria magnacalcarata]